MRKGKQIVQRGLAIGLILSLLYCNPSNSLFNSAGTPFQGIQSDIAQRSLTLPLYVQVAYNSTDDVIFWKLSWAGNLGRGHDYWRYDGTQWVKEGRGFRAIGSDWIELPQTGYTHDDCRSCHYVEADANCSNCHDTSGDTVRRVAGFHSQGYGEPIAESRVHIAIANPQGQRMSGESTWVPNFEKFGCFLACHSDNMDMPVWNATGKIDDHDSFMRLPQDGDYDFGVIDLWYWRAHRSNPLEYADDESIRQIGRGGDNGERPWTSQHLDASGNPEFTLDPVTTSNDIFAFIFEDLSTTDDYFMTAGLAGLPQTLDFGIATGSGYTPTQDDTVPLRMLTMPSGSRADIVSTGSSYDAVSGMWNVYMERDLVPSTGDADDGTTDDVRDVAFVDLDILYYLAFGVHTDESSSRDHYVSFPMSLGFENPLADLNAVEITGANVRPNFDDKNRFPVKVIMLFLPGLASWDFLTGNELGTPVGGPMHGGFPEVFTATSPCISCHTVAEDDPRTATTVGGSMEVDVLRRGGVLDHTPISFFHHIKPVLDTRCGTTSCHGSGANPINALFADGISVDEAYAAVTQGTSSDGPNGWLTSYLNAQTPVESLLLLKPLNDASLFYAHEGGVVFANEEDADFVKLLRWIVFNAPNN